MSLEGTEEIHRKYGVMYVPRLILIMRVMWNLRECLGRVIATQFYTGCLIKQ